MTIGAGANNENYIPGLTAGSDLRLYQYCAVKRDTDPLKVVICGAGEVPVGILQNAPNSGEDASVLPLDGSRGWLMVDTSAVLVGSVVKSDAAGAGTVTTDDNDVIIARAEEANGGVAKRIAVQYLLGARY
jgi:hypothetical protein